MATDKLYFVTRTDISEGRRAAMLIHAMDVWAREYGTHGKAVVVYSVSDEAALHAAIPTGARVAVWREPDFDDALTAFATDAGRLELPLLNGKRPKRRPPWATQ